jgi:hypothetical protein
MAVADEAAGMAAGVVVVLKSSAVGSLSIQFTVEKL